MTFSMTNCPNFRLIKNLIVNGIIIKIIKAIKYLGLKSKFQNVNRQNQNHFKFRSEFCSLVQIFCT